ncbi:TolC family protein [Tundrisphaera lichenicola]|uniref:TolC family protein n=1 Tax=Tundrisphaera lichenicola TaxID=2029860 RepID=UPI003EB934BA
MMTFLARPASAQAPTIPEERSAVLPGTAGSTLGTLPGSAALMNSDPTATSGAILGGRAGTSTPRVPTSITVPGAGYQPPTAPALSVPAIAPLTEVPLYGTLALPSGADEGPPEGMTFDQALDLLIRQNLDLLARRYELDLARADVLTASLRANPLIYADAQLVPYGAYTQNRPGGQTQYDVNISHPIDYSRKRKYRTEAANQAVKVVEAQYQDAVRLQIANLATAYLGVLSARETVRFAQAGLEGLDRILEASRSLGKFGNRTSADVARITGQREAAAVGLLDAREGLRRARLELGGQLNIAPPEAEGLEIRASLRDLAPPPPPGDQLELMALQCRPDLNAFRMGVGYAQAGLRLQQANRFADAYVLYQPYTFQNNSPLGLKSATSYALGVTVPLPIYNRNQGNIARAKVSIDQTRVQLDSLERKVRIEVRQAEQEYTTTRAYLDQLEQTVLPAAKKALEDTRNLYEAGEQDVTTYLTVQKDYNDVVRQYRDLSVRHRRSMFGLNTAVGSRILP